MRHQSYSFTPNIYIVNKKKIKFYIIQKTIAYSGAFLIRDVGEDFDPGASGGGFGLIPV